MRRASLSATALRRALALDHAALVRATAATARGATSERVHQSRVAARRLRSVLRALEGLVDPALAARLSRDLRNLAVELERVREADVRREWLGGLARQVDGMPPAARRQLDEALATSQRDAREALAGHLAGEAWRERLERLAGGFADPGLLPARGDLTSEVASRVARQWERARRALRAAGKDPEALHAARIRVKRARYACEVLLPLLRLDAQPWVGSVKHAQTCLGEHHDATDALEWLESLGEPAGPALLAYLRRPLRAVQRRRLAEVMRLRRSLPRFEPRASPPAQPEATPSSEPMK